MLTDQDGGGGVGAMSEISIDGEGERSCKEEDVERLEQNKEENTEKRLRLLNINVYEWQTLIAIPENRYRQ